MKRTGYSTVVVVALTAAAVALGLTLGASVAQAWTVERDGDNVSAIRDLEIGSFVYDVEFFNYSAAAIYPGDPPRFDFETTREAEDAVEAVVAVLNDEGGVRVVGMSAETGLSYLRVGYEYTVRTIHINFWFLDINQEIGFIKVWEGLTDDPDMGSTNWVMPTSPDVYLYLDDGSFAQFTVVGTAGAGNLPPTADADGPYAGAVGADVSFDGTGSSDPDGAIVAYDWLFGDGSSGSGAAPSHAYGAAGIYNVSLTVTDNSGVSASDSSTAIIGWLSQPPVADADGPYTGTVGAAVSFDGSGSSDPDGTIAAYNWDFGDGNTGSGATPTHIYNTPGPYIVILTVTDDTGETAADSTVAQVGAGNQPPMAAAGAPATGLVGVAVSFDGSGSSDPDGTIMAYEWDFGDGDTGSGATPTHVYSTPGFYIVILSVVDNSDAVDLSVTAAAIDASNQPPVANANGPYTGGVGVAVDFDGTGSSDPDGTIAVYDWDYGDGDTGSGATPSHTYSTAGNYDVTLTVTDDDGATAVDFSTADIDSPNQSPVADTGWPIYVGLVGAPVVFNGTNSHDPDGYITSLAWDFGDGNTGTGEIPTNTYTTSGSYDVIQTATDNDGATDSQGCIVYVGEGNQPPVADADGPYAGAAGAPVSFDGSGSSDPDGTITAYEWDFGDGATGSGAAPSHAYSTADIYNVTLTVTDDTGATVSDASAAVIGSHSQPPVADADGPYAGTVGAAVSFDGSGSSDPDGTIAAYNWDFGDGNTGSGATPTHSYNPPGSYIVILSVTDDTGETATDSTVALIGSGNQPPMAAAGAPATGLVGVAVSFDGSSSSDLDGTITAYEWDFGDGDTGSGATPSHTYSTADRYNVTLTVTDNSGATDSDGTAAVIGYDNQQLIFADDFESGDTTAWSLVVP